MKNKNKYKNLPKITIILIKDNKRIRLHPSLKRTQIFLKNKADAYLKKGYLITITVKYGYGKDISGKKTVSQNSGTYENLEGLRWAYQGFVKEYLE